MAVAGGGHCAVGRTEHALRRGAVDCHHKRVCLKYVLRNRGFHHKILPIRQALHPEFSVLVGENFSQPVFVGIAGGLPAVSLAVGVVAVCGEGGVVGIYGGGAALIHPDNRLFLAGEIVLEGFVVIPIFAVGIQNALRVIGAVRADAELAGPAQIPDEVHRKAGTLHFGCRAARPGGGNDLVQRKAGFQHFIPAGVLVAVNVAGLRAVQNGAVMVGFITQIPCAVGQIVAVIGLGAVQCAGLRYGGILVAVHVVRVFAVLLGEPGGAAGALQSGVQQRVAAGHIILAIAVHRNFHAGAALYHIISAGVQVGEHQLAVLDGGAGDQIVLCQNR